MSEKIGIYGGSFDPVHYGHLNVARQAVETLSLDRLLVIPANVSPFKTDGETAAERRPVYEWSDHLQTLRAIFAAVEKCEVDDRELKRGGVSFAIDTVRAVAAENPGAELFFILGEDSVAGLPRWKDYEVLKTLCTFVPFPRTKESSTEIRGLFAAAKVELNPDAQAAALVRAGLMRKGGFCPCRLPKSPEFFCPCEEFKVQLADPGFHGFCHCRLYLKP